MLQHSQSYSQHSRSPGGRRVAFRRTTISVAILNHSFECSRLSPGGMIRRTGCRQLQGIRFRRQRSEEFAAETAIRPAFLREPRRASERPVSLNFTLQSNLLRVRLLTSGYISLASSSRFVSTSPRSTRIARKRQLLRVPTLNSAESLESEIR